MAKCNDVAILLGDVDVLKATKRKEGGFSSYMERPWSEAVKFHLERAREP
jgi:hypothetical protein